MNVLFLQEPTWVQQWQEEQLERASYLLGWVLGPFTFLLALSILELLVQRQLLGWVKQRGKDYCLHALLGRLPGSIKIAGVTGSLI